MIWRKSCCKMWVGQCFRVIFFWKRFLFQRKKIWHLLHSLPFSFLATRFSFNNILVPISVPLPSTFSLFCISQLSLSSCVQSSVERIQIRQLAQKRQKNTFYLRASNPPLIASGNNRDFGWNLIFPLLLMPFKFKLVKRLQCNGVPIKRGQRGGRGWGPLRSCVQCTVQSVQCTSEVGGSASLKVHFDRTLGGLLPPWRGLCVMIDIFIGVLMKNCQKKK